jgi:molybdopterin/thiamine biosynthesis adenylyltransferase
MTSSPDLARYHRQMLLAGIGEVGQRRLLAAHAVIIGCGALGCAAADLLARAGVGHLTIIDRDIVEPTNLQRQTLFDERDAAEGLPKAEAARRRLAEINSHVRVEAIVADFSPANAEGILRGDAARGIGVPADASFASSPSDPRSPGGPPTRTPTSASAETPMPHLLLDGTDNFETRYLVNDLSVKHAIPYAYAGAVGTRGMQATFAPGGPCLRCIFPEPPPPGSSPTCDTAGILGPVISIVAGAQAADAISVLLGRPSGPATLLDFDIWAGQRRRLAIARDPQCPCCAQKSFDWLDGRRSSGIASLCGRSAVQVLPPPGPAPDLAALAARLQPHGDFSASRFLVRGRLDRERGELGPCDLTVFADGRAIIGGTSRPEFARAIYARYIGA